MNIKEIRKRTKLSQSQFAQILEIPLRTIQDWEQEKRNPPEYIIKMIDELEKRGYIKEKIERK